MAYMVREGLAAAAGIPYNFFSSIHLVYLPHFSLAAFNISNVLLLVRIRILATTLAHTQVCL
jgi:hypothetical protein